MVKMVEIKVDIVDRKPKRLYKKGKHWFMLFHLGVRIRKVMEKEKVLFCKANIHTILAGIGYPRQKIKPVRYSKEFYVTYGGFCNRVPLEGRYKSSEWPYDTRKMRLCTKPGKHPHYTRGLIRGRRRRTKEEVRIIKRVMKSCVIPNPKP